MFIKRQFRLWGLIPITAAVILASCTSLYIEPTACSDDRLILSTSDTPKPRSTLQPTETRSTHTPTPTPSQTNAPAPEPQSILLRGVQGCPQEQTVTAFNPIQIHYGPWGSIGRPFAEASLDLIDITLTIDGEEKIGVKQPVASDLPNHCGSDSDSIYWIYHTATVDGLPPGTHNVEVTYTAADVIDDGTGQTFGPGVIRTSSFTLISIDPGFSVERLPNNPIIYPELLPGNDGENINGPSLIRVPSWIEGALGEYYLYFAHHIGKYIRLAYADELTGEWRIYDGKPLQLEDTICNEIYGSIYVDYKHVASPDIHIDNEAQQIKMYFHCPVYISGPIDSDDSYGQVTLLATSNDGLHFVPGSEFLGNAYFRVFEWDGYYYAISMPGVFYRSVDGLSNFEEGPTLFSENMRHSAVMIRDGKLLVFYSMVGDAPERILLSEIELSPDWKTWTATEPVVVLEPELEWEGANLPLERSYRGTVSGPVRQLRDPAIYIEDGHTYLLYSISGELGIAIAELKWQ